MNKDPYYHICAKAGYFGHTCHGKITWEHSLIYAGKKVQSRFAIIPLCEFGHSVNTYQDGGDMVKEVNVWIALNRATDEELRSISKAVNYLFLKSRLNNKYGKYDAEVAKVAYRSSKRQTGGNRRGFNRGWKPDPYLPVQSTEINYGY